MTSVKGYIQLMERSLYKGDIETTKVRLSKVQNQIEKLNLLIADLLDISNIESGRMRLNQNYFSMSDLVDRVLDVMQPSNPLIEFHHEILYRELIYGDENRIEQVIINFLTNAIKYAPGQTQVIIKTYEKDGQVFFSVRDKGIGMSEENRRNVFEKFYRIEESSERFQGLGIGLYICKEIIYRHEGTIGVNSKLGEGSEFYFSIPLKSI